MKKIDDGGPAFPLKEPVSSDATGMSLRDWFAGQALIGLAMLGGQEHRTPEEDATLAYRHADAMLAARLQGGE